jgi:hypothetical protein
MKVMSDQCTQLMTKSGAATAATRLQQKAVLRGFGMHFWRPTERRAGGMHFGVQGKPFAAQGKPVLQGNDVAICAKN